MTLVFRVPEKCPPVLRDVVLNKGWEEYAEDDPSSGPYWNLWWKTVRFTVSQLATCHYPYQRVNHFPKSSDMTRKDALLRNLRRMKGTYGPIYDFSPESWVLPNEYVKFCQRYSEMKDRGEDCIWICKPSDLSRGRKIFVFRDIGELTYDCNVVVQRYVDDPLLILNHKFDLRIYVLVTSFQPLRVYMYRDLMARLASEPYDTDKLHNTLSHLTNTSLNKYAPRPGLGPGCKWNFQQLEGHFMGRGVDFRDIWGRIDNIVNLTLLSIAPNIPHNPPCFELYGFDIILDQHFKPWLLEVNFSPALSLDEDIDHAIKKPLLSDMLDTLRIRPFDDAFCPQGVEDEVTRKVYGGPRGGPRNPTELTAGQAARMGVLVYPFPRNFSRQQREEEEGEAFKALPPRGRGYPRTSLQHGQEAKPHPARSAPVKTAAQHGRHDHSVFVDREAGKFEVIFPFNSLVADLDVGKGEAVIRTVVGEIRGLEAGLSKKCRQYAAPSARSNDAASLPPIKPSSRMNLVAE
eukprot:GGOE01020785.1.p1 GENE.GGOE01020785.1~~GGOE01020785.1.p1  ORF type:complete len:517 (+),score=124.58 GGOE01020785.1:84-1634(+)